MATTGQRCKLPNQAANAPVGDHRPGRSQSARAFPWETEFPLYTSGPKARIEIANAGDHALIREFLATFGRDSSDDFAHWLDAPKYEPTDRLLVRLGSRIIGHVHLVRRLLVWGDVRIGSVGLNDLAVSPEFAGSDCHRRLLVAASAQATADGSLIATLRGRGGDRLAVGLGWIPCPSHAVTQASARDVLAYLTPQPKPLRQRRAPCVRLWRRVELPALMSVYRGAVANRYGAVWRSETYWQWLLSRKVQEQVLVAERTLKRDAKPAVVGYAMTRGDRVVELMTLPGNDQAAVALLLRACRDAIESGFHSIALHLRTDNPLHELLVTAGGAYASGVNTPSGEMLTCVLNTDRLVREMTPIFHKQARQARISLPVDMTFDIDGRAARLVLSRRGARLIDVSDPSPDSVRRDAVCRDATCRDAACQQADFERILIGRLPVPQAIDDGRLDISSDETGPILSALFPHHSVWQSPLDSRVGF